MIYYIDDIIIFLKNTKDHDHYVCLVLEKFRGLDFTPN
jgi:hypothetical protein